MIKYIIVLLLSFFVSSISVAQISEINLSIEKDTASQHYDCYLFIVSGQATTFMQRLQSSSQITVIVPTGSMINDIKGFMPLVSNKDYKGKKAVRWQISNSIKSPAITPYSDYYAIVPKLSPFAQYNNLKPGDKIKLFSMDITIPKEGNIPVRIFHNFADPKSIDPGMGGGNFSNGFTIGGLKQLYREELRP